MCLSKKVEVGAEAEVAVTVAVAEEVEEGPCGRLRGVLSPRPLLWEVLYMRISMRMA